LLASSQKSGWFDLYEAEQRLVPLMRDDQIDAGATRRFEEAKKLQVASASGLEKAYTATTDPVAKRAVFADLIDDLHFRYTKRRLDRATRKETAQRFYKWGIGVLLPLLLFLILPRFVDVTATFGATMHVAIALYFGVLGAYFSRIIAFQSSLDTLNYDTLVRDYSGWSLITRLLTG
jgi:hypothetical protein